MPTIEERKVIKGGSSSCLICLPKPWVRYNKIKAGDKLEVITNGELTIRLITKENEADDSGDSI